MMDTVLQSHHYIRPSHLMAKMCFIQMTLLCLLLTIVVQVSATDLVATALMELYPSSIDLPTAESTLPGATIHSGLVRTECAILCAVNTECRLSLFIPENNGATSVSPAYASGSCVLPDSSYVFALIEGANEPADVWDPQAGVVAGGSTFLVKPDSNWPKSCKEILTATPGAPSGVYYLSPAGGGDRHKMWCDMTTDGGGWTLVWSYYTLETTKARFTLDGNMVMPRPTWNAVAAVKHTMSTDPPSDSRQYGALEFALWIGIGEEFMVKSNINNWIACQPADHVLNGSISAWRTKSITCEMIRSITTLCPTFPSTDFTLNLFGPGPVIRCGGKYMYYFDGAENKNFPNHDPCADATNKGVNGLDAAQPKGQLWLRGK